MNKTEFAKALAERTDMTVTQSVQVTDEFLDLLKAGVSKGERIAFLGFGTFSVTRRAARTGVNPRNPGQKVKIPARNVVRFAPGTSLKEAANGKYKRAKKATAAVKKDVTKGAATARKVEKKAPGTVKKATPAAKAAPKKPAAKAAPKKPAAKKPAAKAAPKKRK
jgi:DNA-binding protein HU-beta